MANETWAAKTPEEMAIAYVVELLEYGRYFDNVSVEQLAERVACKPSSLRAEIDRVVGEIVDGLRIV